MVILRRPEQTDADQLSHLFSSAMTIDTAKRMILSFQSQYRMGHERIWVIADEENCAVGVVELYEIHGRTEIGYRILKEKRGRGYAYEAVHQLLSKEGTSVICARMEHNNTASRSVLEKNGFHLVQSSHHEDVYEWKREMHMIQIQIKLPDGSVTEKEIEDGTTPEQILQGLEHKPLHQIYGCCLNGYYERLNTPVHEGGQLVFCDIFDSYGNMAMQGSLTLLYLKAVHDVLGKNTKVTMANSLSKGLFTIIHNGTITDEITAKIEARMSALVRDDIAITEEDMDRRHALNWLQKHSFKDERALFESAPDLHGTMVCTLGDEVDLLYNHAVPSTGYLKLFDVRKYRNGVLLRFPHPQQPDEVPVFEEQKLLYDAFSEETHWENLLGVNFASDLNACVEKKEYQKLIQISEALHEKKIAEIAERIKSEGKRIILIAGPSSSGKTSFAKRLCVQLSVVGLKPLYLGTDDYFVNRDDMKEDANGKKDLEGLEAVDVHLFTAQMNDLLSGKKVDLPEFDFIKGEKVFGQRITSIEASQPIVIEGIHGLNPLMTEDIPAEQKFKIYISPLTQLDIDHHHRVPTTDARMLRRMVRDYRTRGRSAAMTIDSWPSVRAGEETNIFPYNGEADVFFNSQCIYELAVLKKYAEPLLKGIHEGEKEYAEAQRMLQFLEFFVSIQDDSVIPNNSIIREFIGGSILVD